MAKDARGAIVSVRLSEEEQQRLRQEAEDRGTSVSDLVRSYVAREVGPATPRGVSIVTAPTSQSAQVEQGVFWQGGDGATSSGATITVNLAHGRSEQPAS